MNSQASFSNGECYPEWPGSYQSQLEGHWRQCRNYKPIIMQRDL